MNKEPNAQTLIGKPSPQNSEYRRLVSAIRYSKDGLRSAWKKEAAARLEIIIIVLSIPLAITLAVSWLQVVLLVGSLVMVLVVELINSALERLCDLITTEYHPEIKMAKDYGSAAVLLTILVSASLWMTLLIHRLYISFL